MTKVIERKRLKFQDDYTYLNRNMIMEMHPSHIHESLLSYFKQEDLHQYPDMWKTYDVLSKYLDVSDQQLLITRGVEGAIKQVFGTLNLSGESVGVVSPTFAMYYVYARSHNVGIIEIEGSEPEYKITVDDIKEVIPKIKVLFLDNPKSHLPNNFNDDELYELIKYCEDLGVIVFLDEVYVGWEQKSYLPNLSKHKNLVIAQSFSKIAFPSLKAGWLITNKELQTRISSTRNSYELDYFACKGIEFLIDNQDYITELKKDILKIKSEWYKELSKSKVFTVYDSKGYVLRLYSVDKELIKKTYNNLHDKRIVVGLVDKFNLVFSVTNNKKIGGIIFYETLSYN